MADPNDKTPDEATVADNETSSDTSQTNAPKTDAAGESSVKDNLDTEDIEKLLDQASESLEQAAGEGVGPESAATPFSLGNLTPNSDSDQRQSIDLLGEVEMDLRIELGRTQMRLEEVLQLRGGSVVALDKLAGDPVDVFVNGRLIARGEVLVMNDNFCIRVTDLVGA